MWWVAVPAVIVVVCVIGQLAGFMDFSGVGKDGKRTAGNLLAPIDGLFAPSRQEALQEQAKSERNEAIARQRIEHERNR